MKRVVIASVVAAGLALGAIPASAATTTCTGTGQRFITFAAATETCVMT